MKITKYPLKENRIKIWTPEGFKYIKNIYHIKENLHHYEIEIDGNITAIIPELFKVKTARGYIKPYKLIPNNDAIICHSKKNLNTLRTLISVKKIDEDIKEWIFIETENSVIVRIFPIGELEENYSCLTEEGEKTQKPLKKLKEGDYVQVGDEFKEILCRKIIDEDEGVIIINMNNNSIFINNICVIPDINFIKNKLKQKE